METPYLLPLTPEQIAAVAAGGGFARCEDPNTHVVYELVQQIEPVIDDDYIREKLAEAEVDMEQGRYSEWNLAEFKRELSDWVAKNPSLK